jgi:hypothetical protein
MVKSVQRENKMYGSVESKKELLIVVALRDAEAESVWNSSSRAGWIE